MYKKPIIVFEGIEGSGKSLHINNVAAYLKKKAESSSKSENLEEIKILKK